MSSIDTLPRLESCIELYLDAWALFGDREFTPADLTQRIVERGRNTNIITGTNEPANRLDLLVAYGLLGRDDGDRYRVRCAPTENVDVWQRRGRSQLETLREHVTDRYERRTSGSERNDERDDLLGHDGAVYARIYVEETETPTAVIENAPEQSAASPSAAGIALCCPAAEAGHAQQLADSLCNGDVAEADGDGFEKVTSEVVGEHKDALEYRLYLRKVE